MFLSGVGGFKKGICQNWGRYSGLWISPLGRKWGPWRVPSWNLLLDISLYIRGIHLSYLSYTIIKPLYSTQLTAVSPCYLVSATNQPTFWPCLSHPREVTPRATTQHNISSNADEYEKAPWSLACGPRIQIGGSQSAELVPEAPHRTW